MIEVCFCEKVHFYFFIKSTGQRVFCARFRFTHTVALTPTCCLTTSKKNR